MTTRHRWISAAVCLLLVASPVWAARGGKPPGIAISAPASTAAGQTIGITVSPVNGASLASVLLLTDRDHTSQTKETAPWSFSYTVPASITGALTVSAMASDTSTDAVYNASTVVQVGTPAALTALTLVPLDTAVGELTLPPYPPFTYYGEIMHFFLNGTFSDGVTRDLSYPASGTTYQSQNANIVTVVEDGGIQAVGEGLTNVIATNSGQSLTIPVSTDFVNPNWGELTGGITNNPDLALTHSGPVVAGAQSIPLTSTTIKPATNVPRVSWTFNNNSGLPQLKVAPGLVTWKLAKGSDPNCSVSFVNNVMPTDQPPYAVVSGTVIVELPPGGGKCVILLNIAGQSDSTADKFTITNPAP